MFSKAGGGGVREHFFKAMFYKIFNKKPDFALDLKEKN